MRNSSSVVDLNIASSSDTARSKAGPKQGMGKAMPISDSMKLKTKQCKDGLLGRSMKKEDEKEERNACSAMHPLLRHAAGPREVCMAAVLQRAGL
jgi:hypothetical protein